MSEHRTEQAGPMLEEIRTSWPPLVNLTTAATAFRISTGTAYELDNRGEFPAEVIRVGSRRRVLTASIVRVLSGEQRSSGDAA